MSIPEVVTQRVQPLLAPISDAAPAGTSAKFDPRYERITAEVAKLDAPAGGAVDWALVVSQGSELLQTASKDLLLGAHVAYGLHATRGLDGLATGVGLLAGMVDQYWPSMFPELKRLRGRVNALSWFIERTAAPLGQLDVKASDRDALELLHGTSTRFAQVVQEKFGADAPAMRPLLDSIDRLKMSLPAEAPPPPPAAAPAAAAAAPPAAAAAAAPAAASAAAAAPAAAPAPAPTLAAGADPTTFLRDFGTSLASAAAELRRADPTQAAAYRTLRTGLWLHLAAAPPLSGGKTAVPPPPAPLRAQLQLMAQNAKWVALLEEAESALQQYRLWLDLHRLSAQALAQLGPTHAGARHALVGELAAFLRRLPVLVDLKFNDDTPFADADTRAWLDSEVLATAAASGSGSGSGAGIDDGEAEALADARKLITDGNLPEAVARLQTRVLAAPSRHARFRARLALARTLLDAGQAEVARALFAGLDEELRQHALDEWDPALAARCIAAHMQCLKSLVKLGRASGQEVAVLYDRLSRLDPVQAMKGGA